MLGTGGTMLDPLEGYHTQDFIHRNRDREVSLQFYALVPSAVPWLACNHGLQVAKSGLSSQQHAMRRGQIHTQNS